MCLVNSKREIVLIELAENTPSRPQEVPKEQHPDQKIMGFCSRLAAAWEAVGGSAVHPGARKQWERVSDV